MATILPLEGAIFLNSKFPKIVFSKFNKVSTGKFQVPSSNILGGVGKLGNESNEHLKVRHRLRTACEPQSLRGHISKILGLF